MATSFRPLSRRWTRLSARRRPAGDGHPRRVRLDPARRHGARQGRRPHRAELKRRTGSEVAGSSRHRSSRARSSPSTIAPARFWRWSAATISTAASSTAPSRPFASSGRRSSRSSTPRPSIAATRRRRSCSMRQSAIRPARQPPYAPLNYDRQFEGPISLRRAIEQSRNIPAVRLMDRSAETGRRLRTALRVRVDVPAYLSTALGAGEATLSRSRARLLGVPRTRACA